MTTLYTTDHEWLRIEGDVATIGITDYAQSQLGDVVFVELPKVGRSLKKARSRRRGRIGQGGLRRLRADLGRGARGQRRARRRARAGQFRRRRQGWFFKLKIADKSELDGLMDEAAYATSATTALHTCHRRDGDRTP